jgi:hypothetical protein
MTKSRVRSMASSVVVTILLLLGMLWFLRAAPPVARNNPRVDWPKSRASQLVFFAVLEGLYRDGVANDDVDLIVPPNQRGEPQFERQHFVYACPLCHPAFEAFRLYRNRQDFFGLKAPVNTFGDGLSEPIRAALRSRDAAERRHAIERMIKRWVTEHLDSMRPSDSERATITSQIEEGRKQGMNHLQQAADRSRSRTNCPICDGSFGACKMSGQ